ncbi:MAG: hypothetical protein M3135_08035 [Actinomycetota bacterium]|nr:hypothetical protein [Actinomycetota bacterium]
MVGERRTVVVRAIAVLVAGGMVVGALSLTPAIGAAKFNKKKAKKLFYTKGGADTRFVNVDEVGAGPVAYAHVNADGTLDTANSRNVTATSEGATDGYYCIDLAVSFENVQATVDGTTDNFANADVGDPLGECAPAVPGEATADAVVSTWDASDGLQEGQPFFVVFT